MNNECILVVDDEARMRKLIKDFLTVKGYTILEAEDGEKALEIFAENSSKINLILLDVMTRWLVCIKTNKARIKSTNNNVNSKRRGTRRTIRI